MTISFWDMTEEDLRKALCVIYDKEIGEKVWVDREYKHLAPFLFDSSYMKALQLYFENDKDMLKTKLACPQELLDKLKR